MGNTCNTQQSVVRQELLTSQPKIEMVSTSNTLRSNLFEEKNKIFEEIQIVQNQYPKPSLDFQYLSQKVLDDQKPVGKYEKDIYNIVRKNNSRGKLFLHQNNTKSYDDEKTMKENVSELIQQLSEKDVQEINQILQNHFLFLQLNETEKNQTIKQMKICSIQAELFVFKQGDQAQDFFIILEGQVQVIIEGQRRKKLKKRKSFGEIALLYGSKRSASVKTLTKCRFSKIDRLTFKRVVEEISLKSEKQNRQFLQKTDFFSYLTPLQQQAVMNAIVTLRYHPKEIIINQGDDANSFYIIKSGNVQILKGKGENIILNPGDQFGEKSLEKQKSKRTATAQALTQCILISIGRQQIVQTLGSTVINVMIRNRLKMATQKSRRFLNYVRKNMQHIVDTLILKKVQKNQKLFKKGHIMKSIYIPFNIELSSFSKIYQVGSIIQENLLIEGKPLLHGIKSESEGNVLQIKVMNDFLKSTKSIFSQISPQTIKLQKLKIVCKIGSGQFGDVFACLHPESNSLLAIKTVSKKKIEQFQIQKQIVNEQSVMKSIEHPFIMKYYNTFIAKRDIHFVIEYIAGKQLFDVIRSIGLLSTEQAQFYSAQILLALEYLHNQNIVYRDLKPQNIMVDTSGYLKIIDMGTAKQLKKEFYYKTKTIIGTPHYMAPQSITGKGYSFLADLWSLGVIIYQFLCGCLPYQQTNSDPFEIFKLIMNHKLEFPTFFADTSAKQLISQLLSTNPKSRIKKGYHQLKKMRFFNDLKWTQLEDKKLPVPYKLQKQIKIDIQNIDIQTLQTVHNFFEKIASKDSLNKKNKKQISWQANLL